MLEAGHYILLLILVVILYYAFSKACYNAGYDVKRRRKFFTGFIVLMIVWVAYVSIVSASGIIATFSMPPRMPLLIVLPAFTIIGWFYTRKKFKEIIDAFPERLTVYFQSFRIIVEILILGLYYKGIGPEMVTFEGRNFDILIGLSAPIIGYLAYNKKAISSTVVIIWNICGLLMLANIVAIFLTLAFKPGLWGYIETPVSIEFTKLPFIFIAGVFMPIAVFLHIFSLVKINRQKKEPHRGS